MKKILSMNSIYYFVLSTIISINLSAQVEQLSQISLDKLRPGEYLEYSIKTDSIGKLYIFREQDFKDIVKVISIAEVNLDLVDYQEKWISNCDSIHSHYQKLNLLYSKRFNLYKSAYEQQFELSTQLSKSFDDLEKLKNRKKNNNFTTGALFGISMGILLGVLLVK